MKMMRKEQVEGAVAPGGREANTPSQTRTFHTLREDNDLERYIGHTANWKTLRSHPLLIHREECEGWLSHQVKCD